MNINLAARIDFVCDSFEKALRSGDAADIAVVLAGADEELRLPLAQQLMLVDAEYRRAKYGVAPSVQEYGELLGIDPRDLSAAVDTIDAGGNFQLTPSLRSKSLNGADLLDGIDGSQPLASRFGPIIPGYEILSELGSGGMGVVYKARQIRAGRVVALKTIRAQHIASEEQVKRFKAEAEAAARLSHHGIVSVYDVGEHNGVHYFSMGFVEGPNLETRARQQILSNREAAEVCRDVADALEYSHRNGVVHRDVKPLNILIGSDGKPRLTDFGLAMLTSKDLGLTSTGQIIGTAAYMPPEQAAGGSSDVGPTADIYALGATLYRCVTGRPPFQAASTIEILRQVVDDEPVSPRRLNREIDSEIEILCLKALEKEPSRRFPSAGEFSAELTRYLEGEPIHSRQIGLIERTLRWCARKPAVASSIGLIVALLLALAVGVPYILLQRDKLQLADLQRQLDAEALEMANIAQAAEAIKAEQAEELAAANAARAATQEYYASVMRVREQRLQPNPKAGWTWEALKRLQTAALSKADGKDPVILRSLVADTLMTPDMREIGRIEGVPNTAAIAVSHDGKYLAAGDWAGNPSCVRIYKITVDQDGSGFPSANFNLVRVCSVDTTLDLIQSGLTESGLQQGNITREGMWAIDFSPDDKQIAVGTRNGNITIWQIDCDPPRILFDRRFPEKHTDHLFYSRDGKHVIVDYRNPASMRLFSVEKRTDEVRVFDGEGWVDSALMPDGRILTSHEATVSRISSDSFKASVTYRLGEVPRSMCVDSCRTVAIRGTAPPTLFDPITGEKTLDLQAGLTAGGRPSELVLAADTTIAIGAVEPQNLRMWDAISGEEALDITFPGNEPPLICSSKTQDRIYVYSTVNMFAYQLRGCQRLAAVDERSIDISNSASPVAAVVAGAQVLSSFDLSKDQQHLAVLETAPLPDRLRTIPESYRARLRKLKSNDGVETDSWTCLHLGSDQLRATLTEGEAVAFTADGQGIAFTTPALGNIAVVSEFGFQFPSGIGIDVTLQPAKLETESIASWIGGEVPAVSNVAGYRPAIAMKLPRGLSQPHERLLLSVIKGETTKQYEISDRHLTSAGWYLINLDAFTAAHPAGTWRIEAILVDTQIKFDAKPRDTGTTDSAAIQVGNLYLLPWKQLKRGKTPPTYPLRLGPLAFKDDGSLATVVESWTLYQWDAGLSNQAAAPWRDVANSEEDIRGVSACKDGHFVGTDSGLVALINLDGTQHLVEPAHTESGSYDSRDGVLTTAVADEVHIAVAGTLRGQIRNYDLLQKIERPVFVTDAHAREITAMAISDDGSLVASAAGDGSLRFWKRHEDRLELLFEMTTQTIPIRSMVFSKNAQYLYTLRNGERAIRRIDLSQLSSLFATCGLELP